MFQKTCHKAGFWEDAGHRRESGEAAFEPMNPDGHCWVSRAESQTTSRFRSLAPLQLTHRGCHVLLLPRLRLEGSHQKALLLGGNQIQTWCLLFSGFFWAVHVARGILVPRPGIEPMPPAVEGWSPNHWTAREVQEAVSFVACGKRRHFLDISFITDKGNYDVEPIY